MSSRRYYVGDCVQLIHRIKKTFLGEFDDVNKPRPETRQRTLARLEAYCRVLDGYTEMYKFWRTS